MELQALLVLGGVGVVLVAVLLLMGLFSASGTSYEEAIAQQRRATTELLALAENKNKPKKNNKKAIKKLARKEKNKENNAAATGSEVDSDVPAESGVDEDIVPPVKPHVEFCPPIIVDVPRDTPPNVKIRKRGKDPKVKPILINKEDPSCISDPSTPPSPTGSVSNHFEEIHPKDEFELLQSSLAAEKAADKKEEVVEKKEKPGKAGKGKSKQPAPAPEPAKEERERRNSGDAPKEQRKGKKSDKKPVEEIVEPPREELVPPLNAPQPSELTTDKLLKQALAAAPPAPAPAPAPAPSPPAVKNKKKKPEPNVLSLMAAAAGDGGGVNVGELVRVVREAALSRTEIQILTDALLNKHHDPLPQHSEWTEGPNDPMQKLKKQLADKEKALADEVEASQALHAKLKELRATLNAERGRFAAGARAAEQAAAAARVELHTQQARLQRVLDENQALQQDQLLLQSKLGAEEAQAQRIVQMEMHIQQLSESEVTLMAQVEAQAREAYLAQQQAAMLAQQQASAVRAAAGRRRARPRRRGPARAPRRAAAAGPPRRSRRLARQHASSTRSSWATPRAPAPTRTSARTTPSCSCRTASPVTLPQQPPAGPAARQQYAQQLGDAARARADADQRAHHAELQLQDRLHASSTRSSWATPRAPAPTRTSARTTPSCSCRTASPVTLPQQPPAGPAARQQYAQQLGDAARARADADQRAHHAELQLQDRLAALTDLQNEIQRLTSRAQFAETNAEKLKEEAESQKQQLSNEIASLREQLAALEAELAEAKLMKVAPAQNGLPANDQHKSAELAKVESVVESLRNALATEQRANSEQKETLARLQEQLSQYQDKNNELRTKNWKVMEALQSAEKALQKSGSALPAQDLSEAISKAQEAQYAEVANVLRLACPAAAPAAAAGRAWLLQFADNLKKEVQKVSAAAPAPEPAPAPAPVPAAAPAADARLAELSAQNDQLQAHVDKYKRIIDETEGVLGRLQQDVSREEARWAAQLADKQRELDEMRARTLTQMQKKIDTLQAELQQKQAANHNHSFADSERLAEERLLTDMSEKYKVDVCNGPLQVGLEEK
ncbi:SMC superfamily domain-containing protein aluminum tubes [Choristoneura fumiferana]|uniref:SMC superfamily domain-containing protein aluminum tubes n=1 Tax=Choristoneura fumiferana TaxID=7141 RepID=UPI003D1593AA